jgi:hypothetical protein
MEKETEIFYVILWSRTKCMNLMAIGKEKEEKDQNPTILFKCTLLMT